MAMNKVDEYIKTSDGQTLALYFRGNPKKPAVIYLHGGPGAAMDEAAFEFFDLTEWYVIGFDQRGCGNSKPFGTLENNLVPNSVADIEMIREHLGINKWLVFGGSYGSTLALAYSIAHPSSVTELVIRGIFLARPQDINWSFEKGGASLYHPDTFEKYYNFLPKEKRKHICQSFYEIFKSDDTELKRKACKVWADWESSLITLRPFKISTTISDYDLSSALLECHFMCHNMGFDDENYLLNNANKIGNIPTYIVHGRYDQDCCPVQAWELKNKLSNVKYFKFTEATGHLSHEPANRKELRKIMNMIIKERH
ncbi:MAG: prolyl aminopeptidase [Bacilli bacterium]|nr:prolyl aminopeptidase [Bacilli bacterium]MDD3422566.1 prolyl aminopeptidase [Bacilli bacterium]